MTKKIGVTIGKFRNFHKGHLLMLEAGLKTCDFLHIIVSDTSEYDIDAVKDVINKTLKNNGYEMFAVYTHLDMSPLPVNIDENSTVLDPEFQEYWKKRFQAVIPKATHFVSSDKYGDTMAKLLGIKWIPVDVNRELFDVSSTKIEEEPFKYFKYLTKLERINKIKSVVVVGPESTGKSTMTKTLAAYFSQYCSSEDSLNVPEYGRIISEEKENKLDGEDFANIAEIQHLMIESAKEASNSPVVFVDTECYTTRLFSYIYLNEDERKKCEPIFDHIQSKQDFSLYILLAPTVKWVDDGSRVLPDQYLREKFFNDMKNYLDSNGKNYVVIDATSFLKRNLDAIYAVKELFDKKSVDKA